MKFEQDFVKNVITCAKRAGNEILKIYRSGDFEVTDKADGSPLTQADKAAHDILIKGLKALSPGIPALSEESPDLECRGRCAWNEYWLIDPLDGTREFLHRNDEFTVNVALIKENGAVFGVVHAPALGMTYWGGDGLGAFKEDASGQTKPISVRARPENQADWKIIGSRAQALSQFGEFVSDYPDAKIVNMGSSLKFCLVAEGLADIYPRLGPTSEWDTAAAQAVVEAAGGRVLEFSKREALRYNTKENTLLNPHFIVCGEPL